MIGFLVRFAAREGWRAVRTCGRSLRDDWVWIGRALDDARQERDRG